VFRVIFWIVFTHEDFFRDFVFGGHLEYLHRFYTGLVIVSCFFYFIARLFLLVEVFRMLCFLPPDAYISTWAANIPHIA